MESTDRNPRPGQMDAFRITELSGVGLPACEGCRATFIKAAGQDVDAYSPEALRRRGEALMASPSDEEEDSPELGPGESMNWAKTAAAHHAEFTQMAKSRAKSEGCTFEQAYSKVLLEHPSATRRMIQG